MTSNKHLGLPPVTREQLGAPFVLVDLERDRLTYKIRQNDAGGSTCDVFKNGEYLDGSSASSAAGSSVAETAHLRAWVSRKYPTAVED